MKHKKKNVKSFNQFLKPFYPFSKGMGISYYDYYQDTDMNDNFIDEDEETIKKSKMCTCNGIGCDECNGIGCLVEGDLD